MPQVASRGVWGDYKPARGFSRRVAGYEQMIAQARLDRCRGCIAHNLDAILRAGHIFPHLPHDYRARYDSAYRKWHEEAFGYSVRITCAVCGLRVDAAFSDVPFKQERCPLGGTMQAVQALEAALRSDLPLLERLTAAAGTPPIEYILLSKQPHLPSQY